MNKLACIAAIAAISLAGCSQREEAEAPAPEETAAAPSAEPMGPDGLPLYGVFEVTSADGETKIMQNIKRNGTLINVVGDSQPVPGTWEMDADDNFCLTMEGEEEASCYAEAMTDDVWTATNIADAADSWTVKRVMGSEALPSE